MSKHLTAGRWLVVPPVCLVLTALVSCLGTEIPDDRLVRLFEEEDWASVESRGHWRRAFSTTVGSRVAESVVVPGGARLDWAVAALAHGDHARVEARILLAHGDGEEELSSQILRPRRGRPGRWIRGRADLSAWAGREVELIFETRRRGLRQARGNRPTTVFWASPRLTAPGRGSDRPTSVVFVLVDTLRADRLGCYGNPRATTPSMDRLAARGVLFENAFSQANWTLPSIASLFSALYPSGHGVEDGESRLVRDAGHLVPLMLRNGYLTAGFHAGGYLDGRFGFAQGFDTYRRWDGFRDLSRAVTWLENHGDTPFFLFLHTYDVHAPYGSVPEEYWRTFLDDEQIDEELLVSKPDEMTRAESGRTFSERELGLMLDLYDGEIRFVDDRLGRFLDELERLELVDDVLIVLTSDHGEEFGEHGLYEHGTHNLYTEVSRVPLIVAGPGLPRAHRVGEPVQLVDLLPTLTRLLSLEDGAVEGLDGVELCRYLGVRTDGASEDAPRHPRRALTQFHETWALRSAEWTLIETARGEPLLFDRAADPGEVDSVADAHPEVVTRERSIATRLMLRDQPGSRSEETEIDESLRRELRALGYVD